MEGSVSLLDFELLRRLDLKLFDQDELLWLSQAASVRYADIRNELVIPSIDRTMFNESASSKKQTFNTAYAEDGERKVDLAEDAAMSKRLMEMRGAWVSAQKREKIIGAQGFPDGWKVTVGLSYRDGRCFLSFRNYESPDGHSWPTFKAAASFLSRSFIAGQKSTPPEEKQTEGTEAIRQVEQINVESDGSRDEGEYTPQVVNEQQQLKTQMSEVNQQQQQESIPQVSEVKQQQQQQQPSQSESQSQLKSKSGEQETPTDRKANAALLFTCDTCGKAFSKKNQHDGHRAMHVRYGTKRKSLSSPSAPAESSMVHKLITPSVPSSSSSSLTGWLDEGCYICKAPIPGVEQLAICNWCENEFHLGCVGGAQALTPGWICPNCAQ